MPRLIILFFACALALLADGGTLLFRKPAGSWVVTALCAPAPLRAGAADLSVMVQRTDTQTAVLDASVKVHLTKSSAGEIHEIVAPATRAQATNKLLYGARVTLPSAGKWQLQIDVSRSGEAASVSGEINVLPAQAPLVSHWPYIVLIPLIVLLFALNQWIRRDRRITRARARP